MAEAYLFPGGGRGLKDGSCHDPQGPAFALRRYVFIISVRFLVVAGVHDESFYPIYPTAGDGGEVVSMRFIFRKIQEIEE